MTESSETPIGQSPATGGRVKQYPDAAARAKAHRARQKELVAIAKGSSAPDDADDMSEQPESAITSLAYAIGELRRIGEFQAHFAARIDEAISRVADPAKLDAALETTKTHALRQVSEAQAVAADAKVEAQEARGALREVTTERDAALEDAATALERLADVQLQAEWLVAEAGHLAALRVADAERDRDVRVAAAEQDRNTRVADAERDRDARVAEAMAAQAAAEESARASEETAHARVEELTAAHESSLQAARRDADERIEQLQADTAQQVQMARAAADAAEGSRIRAEAERDASDRTAADLRADLHTARDEISRLHDQMHAEDRIQAQRTLRRGRPAVAPARRRRML